MTLSTTYFEHTILFINIKSSYVAVMEMEISK